MKKCKCCEKELDDSDFSFKTKGSLVLRSYCKKCDSKLRQERDKNNGTLNGRLKRLDEKRKLQRKNNENTATFIYIDSRKSDKKKNLSNDLDKEYIHEQIKNGCTYCGETTIRMTLDRIDNTKGHTRENVVPSCIRCNLTRGSMPYNAWLLLAQKMREIREMGLFDGWIGK